jgi:hypothetical protein
VEGNEVVGVEMFISSQSRQNIYAALKGALKVTKQNDAFDEVRL